MKKLHPSAAGGPLRYNAAPMKLYSTLADWWPLLSPVEDYAAEAEHYWRVLTKHSSRQIETLLELGCGGGNNATHLKRHCRPTLTDVSSQMLAVSRRLNPDCEHAIGDMRRLRLRDDNGDQRVFDAVFIHDAVMYLTSESDLRGTMETAFVHTAPGGAALLVPDCTRETWTSRTDQGGRDGDERGLRYLSWSFDPNPQDTQYTVEMVYLLRTVDRQIHVEHERHEYGLFAEALWLRLLQNVGFVPAVEPCGYPGGESARCFVGVRPPIRAAG